ncbi:MAG: DUF3300 domain-containing protein [Pseudomonadales bacterium]|nr:DUF3300 domain-containing protein [Pseudomonadales bacterium]
MITTREYCRLFNPILAIAGFYIILGQTALAQDANADNSNAIDASAPISTNSTSAPAEVQADTAPELGGLPAQEILYTTEQLQFLVGPYALYPDDLLAIVLPASTYPLEIVLAARFLERLQEDENLEPEESWDDSIIALLNYPEVIEIMNENIDSTWQLGEAVISQQTDVLEAIEDFRQLAFDAGNLETDERQTVEVVQEAEQETIVITQVEKEVVYVPQYIVEEVIVEQHVPVYHYHPVPRPVYYYPYPVGHRFHSGFFWGVTTAFSIGWSDHFLHVYHPSYRYHPYYGSRYYYNDYHYRRPSINVFNNYYVNNSYRRFGDRHRYGSYWRPQRHFGSRPYDNRYDNYYVGGRSYNGGGDRRNVGDFAADRRRSQANGPRSLSNPNSASEFSAQRGRGTGDRRSGGRINGGRTNGEQLNDLGSNANALTAGRATRGDATRNAQTTSPVPRGTRRTNGSSADGFNALRGSGAQSARTPAPNASAATRETNRRNVEQNTGATFDAFRNRSRGRSVSNSNNSRRTAPREDSSAIVAPANPSTTTAQTRRPTRNSTVPRISSDRQRRNVTSSTPRQRTQVQRQPRQQTETRSPASGVSRFSNQRSQRNVGGDNRRRANVQSQSSSRSCAQSSTPRRQAPSVRSNSNQRSSTFNSSRRGSSSVQRSQRSQPQVSRPSVRSQPAPRSNRSAASSSSRRPSAVGGRSSRATGNRRNP